MERRHHHHHHHRCRHQRTQRASQPVPHHCPPHRHDACGSMAHAGGRHCVPTQRPPAPAPAQRTTGCLRLQLHHRQVHRRATRLGRKTGRCTLVLLASWHRRSQGRRPRTPVEGRWRAHGRCLTHCPRWRPPHPALAYTTVVRIGGAPGVQVHHRGSGLAPEGRRGTPDEQGGTGCKREE